MDFTDESDHPVAASNPSRKRIRDFDDEGNDDDEDMEEEEEELAPRVIKSKRPKLYFQIFSHV